MLGVSNPIALHAKDLWTNYEVTKTTKSRAAIWALDGYAYKKIDVWSLNDSEIGFLENSLRIIDPLYGILKPLDLMQEYRVEMATKGVFDPK
jgi:cytoplasmic iron level regulating protein YaaA (DUF328/UPF0246 family)